jgi:hypothetical protein
MYSRNINSVIKVNEFYFHSIKPKKSDIREVLLKNTNNLNYLTGPVDLSKLFFQQFVSYLYKAEPFMCIST